MEKNEIIAKMQHAFHEADEGGLNPDKCWEAAYAVVADMLPVWKPIENAPGDGTEIIVSDSRDVHTARYRISNCSQYAPFFAVSADGELFNRGTDWSFEPDYRSPTHWMPLPTPPNQPKVTDAAEIKAKESK